MIQFAGRASAFLLVTGLTTACAQLGFLGAPNMADHRQQAEELVRQGNLTEALAQLRVLETLRPDDLEITKMRRSVEAKTKRLAKSHYQKAEATAKRSSRRARQEYIAVLAYDPQHEGALRRLRQLELRRVRGHLPGIGGSKTPTKLASPRKPTQMAAAATTPNPSTSDLPKPAAQPQPPAAQPPAVNSVRGDTGGGGDLARRQSLDQAIAMAKAGTYLNLIEYAESYLSRHPGDRKAMELLALSHERVGLALYRDGNLRESLNHLEFAVANSGDSVGSPGEALADAKTRLANETFEQGVRVFRQDISQAIVHWEDTLAYDPDHAKAKVFLSKAYRIRDRLNAIANP